MNRLGPPAALAAGLGLLALINASVLGVAAWNRRGGPRGQITLTERELALPEFREEESSVLSLSLALGDVPPPPVARVFWNRGRRPPREEHPWLDRAKLRELGFRTGLETEGPVTPESFREEPPRLLFLALEFEGEAWRRWLAKQEAGLEELRRKGESGGAEQGELREAETLFELDRTMRSRLIPVDAAADPESLERRYPDRSRHLVVRGTVSLSLLRPLEGAPRVEARVEVLPDRVHVPVSLRGEFREFLPRETAAGALKRRAGSREAAWPSPVPPRYRAVLAFGRRFDPWLVSAAPIAGGAEAGR